MFTIVCMYVCIRVYVSIKIVVYLFADLINTEKILLTIMVMNTLTKKK